MQNQDVRHKNPRLSGQSGNALWYILVAIALLAALTLSLTRNSGKVADNLSQQESRVIAEKMARDLTVVRQTVERLMTVNKCSVNEISFDNDVFVGSYVNPTSPSDQRCHVYRAAGGGLNVARLPPGSIMPGNAWAERGWVYLGSNSINGVGPESITESICASNCADLIMLQQVITENVCLEFNKLLNVNNGAIPLESNTVATGVYYVGTFGAGTASGNRISTGTGDSTTSLYGVNTACVQVGATNWMIYSVLVAR